MVTDVSTGRSTNELLAAATRGESAAVEALYTHYLQFGTDVALEHGSDDPLAAYDQAFLETMAHSLKLSRAEPGSFASHIEAAIRSLPADGGIEHEPTPETPSLETAASLETASPETPSLETASPESSATETSATEAGTDSPPTDRTGDLAEGTEDTDGTAAEGAAGAAADPVTGSATGPTGAPPIAEAVADEELTAEATAAELGILPLAASASRPRTPNQLLDRLHVRSLVPFIAAVALAVLIGWVLVQSTSAPDPDAEADPNGQITPAVEPTG